MTPLIIVLMLTAALLHASWHVMLKSTEDRFAMLTGMSLVGSTIAATALPFVPFPKPEVWTVLWIAVALHVSYMTLLPVLYKHHDISQAYPLARGMVPLLATIIAYPVLNEVPTTGQAIAILSICIGLMLVAWNSGGNRFKAPLILAAFLTGLMVAGYSVVDGYGTRLNGSWFGFTVWLIVLTGLVFMPLATTINGLDMWRILARSKGRALISGLLGIGTFSVFLWALSLGAVGSVTALREVSILFTTVFGFIFLQEKFSRRRLAGAIVIMMGVIFFIISAAV